MNSLQQIAAFADTAKHGSFAAAARGTGSAPSTLAKAVGRLEGRLGVKLFHRTTRQVSLTPDGGRLFRRCQRLLAEVDELQAEAAGVRESPTGTLRVDLPIVLGRRVILPVLARLRRQHPGLELDVRLQDGYADLVKEGIDLAVRAGDLKDSTLVSRRFMAQAMVLVASPAYLQERGTPRRLEQLAQHDALVFRMPTSGKDRPWQFRQRGRALDVHPASGVRISDGEGLVQAALLGMGLAQLPDYFVRDEIGRGELVEVLPALRPAPIPISIVYPGARLVPQRVRVVIDALLTLKG
ncbi:MULTISPECIES: LysR family transcriptional regulator [Ramlibacter]|uniref:LysR family transcriptional regulator n=1 Tax=Ramlibacter pinisoli TaxID=2682844 RepID=A0A6N8IPX9_9BURK|nr:MULTISPECIES: LysR family transcriptional regulator [Ramlibacter]MBA2963983.1 LysR family transcriptional regulator [Ramlibacter sp. CGMCC 1.13660]MVQ28949.1 LysR family transcriptional regulator [Ramlibacter pinisoli]